VWMIERRDRPRFALEPFAELRILSEGLGQDLDRDRAVEAGVASFVHLAHAASTYGGLDLVRAETRAGLEWHLPR
jgi:hypothetical protein